jgi:hypothetical protein
LFRGLTEESFGGKNDFPQRMAMAAKEATETTHHLLRKLKEMDFAEKKVSCGMWCA